jgi:Uma2 family endonuclease
VDDRRLLGFDRDVTVRPRILVVDHENFGDSATSRPPLLAVDAPSTGDVLADLDARKQIYARSGVRDYWVVDLLKPRLIAFALDDQGQYRTIAKVTGDEPFQATSPFQVRIVLTELLGSVQ